VTGPGTRHIPRSWHALLTRTRSTQGTDRRAGPLAPGSSNRADSICRRSPISGSAWTCRVPARPAARMTQRG